jgi:hypothetical protein
VQPSRRRGRGTQSRDTEPDAGFHYPSALGHLNACDAGQRFRSAVQRMPALPSSCIPALGRFRSCLTVLGSGRPCQAFGGLRRIGASERRCRGGVNISACSARANDVEIMLALGGLRGAGGQAAEALALVRIPGPNWEALSRRRRGSDNRSNCWLGD